jgi:hypothetical protein
MQSVQGDALADERAAAREAARVRREARYVAEAVKKAKLAAEKAELEAQRREEREEREEQWRAACRELAVEHVAKAQALLALYLAGGPASQLGQAQEEVEKAWRNATQPLRGGGRPRP